MKQLLARLQDRGATLLGLDPSKRTAIVHGMLHRPRGDSAGYWLQLLIAATLATLGLALDSTAVVIGAMLIAPLMRPIVELAMGLATGSAPLIFPTGLRAVASIVIVVGASALFSAALPFHEVTGELLGRTAPSILDLFVAAACALAGAYAVVISGNDVATTAAGTSIGISLVPPLCTVGYGISIGDWEMAAGAALLFTANVSGIITVAGAVFVLVGFGQVDIREQERSLDDDADVGAATRFGRVVSSRGRRVGALLRIAMPLLLLAAIAYPLIAAVDEMSTRSTVRQHVARLMTRSSGERIVQYSLDQAARPVVLRVVIVGDTSSARAFERKLRGELATLGETTAAVSVWAVSDATAVSALSARLDDVPAVVPSPSPPPPSLEIRVRQQWPRTAGELISVWIGEGTPPHVRVVHLGSAMGPMARELFARAVDEAAPPLVEELALSPVEVDDTGLEGWLPRALAMLGRASELPNLQFCVATPPELKGRRATADVTLARAVLARAASDTPNIQIIPGAVWALTLSKTPCTPPASETRGL